MAARKGSKGRGTTRRGAAARDSAAHTSSASELQQRRMAALSNALTRAGFVQKMAGKQFGGERDIYASAGYVQQGKTQFSHFWGAYKRGDVAGRIVDMPALTTWRLPPIISEPDQPNGTDFTKAVDELAKSKKLWHYLSRVDRLAGVGRYSVMLFGLPAETDAELAQPVEDGWKAKDGLKSLGYLAVYHEGNAKITEWETDPGNERFGLPKMYELTSGGATDQGNTAGGAFPKTTLKVHASRILHAAEDLIEDDVFGRPRLERVLNRLFDLDKVAASTGEAYWQLVARILQARIDPTMTAPDDKDLEALDEKLTELTHDLRRQFYGHGVQLEWLGGETPNVQQVADFYFSLLAGGSGIPKRILFGSELGELASTTDQATWMGVISERQLQFAEPVLLRGTIDRLVGWGILPEPGKKGYDVTWPSLFEESDTVVAEGNLKRAQTAQALTPVGADPLELVEIDAEGNVWLKETSTGDVPGATAPGEDDDLEELDDDAEVDGDGPAATGAGDQGKAPVVEGEETAATGALNGAQVASLIKTVESVKIGLLSKSSAMAIVRAAFPVLTEEQVNAIFKDVTEGTLPTDGGDGGDSGASSPAGEASGA